MDPLISIIIPAYNSADYIEDCIQSLYAQTYSNWEVILIDDGSTDNTGKLVAKCCEADSRICVFSQCNQGVSVARNYGLEQSKGEYVVFLDSDDMLHPLFLQKCMERLVKRQADIAGCQYIKIDSENMKEEYEKRSVENFSEKWKSSVEEAALHCFHVTKTPYLRIVTCKLIRREVIGNLRFEQGVALCEDTLFMYELMLKGIRLEQTDTCWYYYRMQGKSATHNWRYLTDKNPYYIYIDIRNRELQSGRCNYARIWEGIYMSVLVGKFEQAKEHKQKDVWKNLRKEADKVILNRGYKGFSRPRILYVLYFHFYPVQKICAGISGFIQKNKGEK